jgi:hypothetical protein
VSPCHACPHQCSDVQIQRQSEVRSACNCARSHLRAPVRIGGLQCGMCVHYHDARSHHQAMSRYRTSKVVAYPRSAVAAWTSSQRCCCCCAELALAPALAPIAASETAAVMGSAGADVRSVASAVGMASAGAAVGWAFRVHCCRATRSRRRISAWMHSWPSCASCDEAMQHELA